MSSFMLQRRRLLQTLLTIGVAPLTLRGLSGCSQQTLAGEYWVSAQGMDEQHFGLGFSAAQNTVNIPTGFRGHGVLQHPRYPQRVLMLSRRPGREFIEADLTENRISARISCQPGRHLHGHACFSQDGRYLYTTESDYHTGRGKVVVRDGLNYQWLAEFDSQGIGPHELKLMPDGKTLAVANGGLRTHPESGRKILNLDTMRSSLVYLRASDGELTDEQTLAEPKASIRHLDIATDGTVAVATQLQREAMSDSHLVYLGAVHKPGGNLQPLLAEEAIMREFNDYMGSVVVHNQQRLVAFSSPRGNLVGFWHLDSAEFVNYYPFHDVCGLAVSHDQQHFALSNSAGNIRLLNAVTLAEESNLRRQAAGMHWDNHMISVTL